jgi:hypothetical protein
MGPRSTEYVTKLVPEMDALAAKYNDGDDLILRKAPSLLLFCADSVGGTFAGVNQPCFAQCSISSGDGWTWVFLHRLCCDC